MKAIASALFFAISLFGQTYTVSTFAGGGLPSNVLAATGGIGAPGAVAVDTSGNLYFTTGSIVLRMDAATRILTVVAGTGVPGFSGDNGPATSAQLNQPGGLALDFAGDIYMLDNNRVREISGGIITTIAGNGTSGATGDNGPATAAEIDSGALTVDAAGNVYLVNSVVTSAFLATPAGPEHAISYTVRKISNGIIATIAGSGTCCTQTAASNVPATSVPLYEVMGIAVDSAGNLYLGGCEDYGCPNSAAGATTYAVFQVANGKIATVASGETVPPGIVFSDFNGLAVDSADNLYVSAHDDILEISGGAVSVFAGIGTWGFSGDGGPATSAQLHEPGGVAVDSAGNVYISDFYNLRIREVSKGTITTAVGDGGYYYGGDNGPATSAELTQPAGLILDSTGNLYIADAAESRIRKVSNGIISTVAGNGTAGYSGDGGPATAAELNNPQDVAVDSAGNIYIADSNNNVVRKISRGVIATVAGGGPHTPNFGDGGPATSAYFESVWAVAVDSAGNLFISDYYGNRVREVSNGIITTVTASVIAPQWLAVDSAGNLYIDGHGADSIVKVSNGVVATVAGNGMQGASGDGGPATAASLFIPQGIAVDSAGNLYIADTGVIREVAGGIINTIAGSGTSGFSGENLPALGTAVAPYDVAVDSAGKVYFSEPGDGRVRVLTPTASNSSPTATPSISQVVSAASFQAPIEAGSWVMIQGANLANHTRVWQSSDFNGSSLPAQLDGASVTIDGKPAFVEYISPSQINVQAPTDSSTGTVNVVVTNNGVASAPATAQLQAVAPALFMTPTYNAIASVIPSYTPVTAAAPAMPGDVLVLWGTGFGPTTPSAPAGTIVTGAPATSTIPVVTVGGVNVPVVSSVLTTGTAGLYQITIQLPNDVPTGAIAIQASIGGMQTQSGVTLFVGAQ